VSRSLFTRWLAGWWSTGSVSECRGSGTG
jgi:hypothetical protein